MESRVGFGLCDSCDDPSFLAREERSSSPRLKRRARDAVHDIAVDVTAANQNKRHKSDANSNSKDQSCCTGGVSAGARAEEETKEIPSQEFCILEALHDVDLLKQILLLLEPLDVVHVGLANAKLNAVVKDLSQDTTTIRLQILNNVRKKEAGLLSVFDFNLPDRFVNNIEDYKRNLHLLVAPGSIGTVIPSHQSRAE